MVKVVKSDERDANTAWEQMKEALLNAAGEVCGWMHKD